MYASCDPGSFAVLQVLAAAGPAEVAAVISPEAAPKQQRKAKPPKPSARSAAQEKVQAAGNCMASSVAAASTPCTPGPCTKASAAAASPQACTDLAGNGMSAAAAVIASFSNAAAAVTASVSNAAAAVAASLQACTDAAATPGAAAKAHHRSQGDATAAAAAPQARTNGPRKCAASAVATGTLQAYVVRAASGAAGASKVHTRPARDDAMANKLATAPQKAQTKPADNGATAAGASKVHIRPARDGAMADKLAAAPPKAVIKSADTGGTAARHGSEIHDAAAAPIGERSSPAVNGAASASAWTASPGACSEPAGGTAAAATKAQAKYHGLQAAVAEAANAVELLESGRSLAYRRDLYMKLCKAHEEVEGCLWAQDSRERQMPALQVTNMTSATATGQQQKASGQADTNSRTSLAQARCRTAALLKDSDRLLGRLADFSSVNGRRQQQDSSGHDKIGSASRVVSPQRASAPTTASSAGKQSATAALQPAAASAGKQSATAALQAAATSSGQQSATAALQPAAASAGKQSATASLEPAATSQLQPASRRTPARPVLNHLQPSRSSHQNAAHSVENSQAASKQKAPAPIARPASANGSRTASPGGAKSHGPDTAAGIQPSPAGKASQCCSNLHWSRPADQARDTRAGSHLPAATVKGAASQPLPGILLAARCPKLNMAGSRFPTAALKQRSSKQP